MANHKKEAIRWTIQLASAEFGIDRLTLSKRLTAESIEAAEDGKFSTAQICQAIYSDKEIEETLLTRAKREREEIKLMEDRQRLVSTELVLSAWASSIVTMRTIVLASSMTEQEKTDFLAQLRDKPISEYFDKKRVDDPDEGDGSSVRAV